MDEYDNDNHDADESDDLSQEDAFESAPDNGNSRLAGESWRVELNLSEP